jgi:hypothetical protein
VPAQELVLVRGPVLALAQALVRVLVLAQVQVLALVRGPVLAQEQHMR